MVLSQEIEFDSIFKDCKLIDGQLHWNIHFGNQNQLAAPFFLDFNFASSVFDLKASNIPCDSDDQCSTEGQEGSYYYQGQPFSGLKATIPVRMEEDALSSTNQNTLPFIYLTKGSEVLPDRKGVIGMAPNSALWKYLLTYQKAFEIGFDFSVDYKDRFKSFKTRGNFQFSNDVVVSANELTDEQFWSFPVEILYKTSWKKGKGCIDLNDEQMISFDTGEEFCTQIFKKMCGDVTCDAHQYDLKNVEDLTVNIYDKKHFIYKDEFIKKGQKQVLCLITNKKSSNCDIILGRKFLTIYKPVFSFKAE